MRIVHEIEGPAVPASLSRTINAALAPTGWRIFEVTVNEISGFARLVAERRDRESGCGVKVTLLRSHHLGAVLEQRDVVELRPGMYRDFWEVTQGGFLGRRTHKGIRSAIRALAGYIQDNGAGAIPSGAARQALRPLAAAFYLAEEAGG